MKGVKTMKKIFIVTAYAIIICFVVVQTAGAVQTLINDALEVDVPVILTVLKLMGL